MQKHLTHARYSEKHLVSMRQQQLDGQVQGSANVPPFLTYNNGSFLWIYLISIVSGVIKNRKGLSPRTNSSGTDWCIPFLLPPPLYLPAYVSWATVWVTKRDGPTREACAPREVLLPQSSDCLTAGSAHDTRTDTGLLLAGPWRQ